MQLNAVCSKINGINGWSKLVVAPERGKGVAKADVRVVVAMMIQMQ
jgi:hypothetical protein